jgi:hypothetical protein
MNIFIYLSGFIYLFGFLACYILLKYLRNQLFENTWSLVFLSISISLLSWIGLALILIIMGILYLVNKLDSEPPKWL